MPLWSLLLQERSIVMVNLNVLTYIPYKKLIEGKEIEKISIKTEKVNSKPFKEIYNLLSSSRMFIRFIMTNFIGLRFCPPYQNKVK